MRNVDALPAAVLVSVCKLSRILRPYWANHAVAGNKRTQVVRTRLSDVLVMTAAFATLSLGRHTGFHRPYDPAANFYAINISEMRTRCTQRSPRIDSAGVVTGEEDQTLPHHKCTRSSFYSQGSAALR